MGRKILLTAFEPFAGWEANASELCLERLRREAIPGVKLTTRVYPVDFRQVRERISVDLAAGFDLAIHLGQAAGSDRVCLESVALNVAGKDDQAGESDGILETDAPLAYRTDLPLARWVERLRGEKIPVEISHHAGVYLCNAVFYWSLHLAERSVGKTRSLLIHVPLETSQARVAGGMGALPSLPAVTAARAVRLIIEDLDGIGVGQEFPA